MKEKINNNIINIIFYSFIFLPISLISGPLISEILISSIVILFIFYCLKNNQYKYFKNQFFYIFIFFYFWCLFCALLSDHKLVSSLKSLVYFRFFVFALAVWFLFDHKKKIINFLLFSMLFCFLILLFDGYFQYFTGKNIIGYEMQGVRLSSFFGEELILGSYLSRFLPVIIALYFLSNYSKIKNLNIFLILFVLITSSLIFLSGERAAFLFVIFTFFYLIIMPNKFSKILIFLLLIFIISISVFSVHNKNIKERMFSYTIYQADISGGFSNFSEHHKGHYLIAWDLFKKNKFFGVGPKNFYNKCKNDFKYQQKPYACTTHPHNSYMQLLSETGILGFLTIFSLFLYLCYLSIKHICLKIFKNKKYFDFPIICVLASLMITLWPLIPTGSFFNNYINIIYFFPVGIFLWLKSDKK